MAGLGRVEISSVDAPDTFDPVRTFDKNGNGFVCAFALRGTRAYLNDPQYTLYTFGVADDRHVR